MHHPTPATVSLNEAASPRLAGDSWGGRELVQEIALLEEHLFENETDIFFLSMYAFGSALTEDIESPSKRSLMHSLLQSIDQISGEHLSGVGLDFFFRKIFNRVQLTPHRQRFFWLVIKAIRHAQAARNLIRLKLHSEHTCLTAPLPANAPELSRYPHRFR
ncbi:hypothetical protein [Pseudomonas saliphila]|uniref:hypothetical protein n=1 Tax=Pseudomonas saliphila TaxID=2586906 RepID=UPI00123BD858|nr:hypothetical protein [Pseudomonas saliphila]